MTLAPFQFTLMHPAAAPIVLPSPLPDATAPLVALMRTTGGRRTARGWATLAGLRLSVVEIQLKRLGVVGAVLCSAQLWEAA